MSKENTENQTRPSNNTKKRRTESEMELDSSISSTIAEFRQIQEPTNKDIGSFLATFMETSQSMFAKYQELQDNINNINERVSAHKHENDFKLDKVAKEINSLKTTLSEQSLEIENLKANSHTNEAKVNAVEQARLDNDIYLSGFPEKPNAKMVATKLCNKFEIIPELIDYTYQFSFDQKEAKPRSSTPKANTEKKKTFHNVVISFKDKATKTKFMIAKKNHGPFKYEMLAETNATPEENVTINCNNRLSKFNLQVQHMLLQAKASGKVFGFQLHNGFQRYKKTENGKWHRITTEDELVAANLGRENF